MGVGSDDLQGQAAINAEPLRETNNPQLWLILGAVIFVFILILGAGVS